MSDETRNRIARALTIVAALATVSYPLWAPGAAVLVGELLSDDRPPLIASIFATSPTSIEPRCRSAQAAVSPSEPQAPVCRS